MILIYFWIQLLKGWFFSSCVQFGEFLEKTAFTYKSALESICYRGGEFGIFKQQTLHNLDLINKLRINFTQHSPFCVSTWINDKKRLWVGKFISSFKAHQSCKEALVLSRTHNTPAPVDSKGLPGDEGGPRACQEGHCLRHLGRQQRWWHWNTLAALLMLHSFEG